MSKCARKKILPHKKNLFKVVPEACSTTNQARGVQIKEELHVICGSKIAISVVNDYIQVFFW